MHLEKPLLCSIYIFSALFLICVSMDKMEAKSVIQKTTIEIDELSLYWEISNFSFLPEKTGQFLTSEEFYSENDKEERWAIQFYPRGSKKNSDNYEYVSVQLKCVTSYRPEINFKFSMELMNSKENRLASKSESDLKSISRETTVSSDWLIRREDLLKEIPDDTVIITCNVKVPKIVRNSDSHVLPLPSDNGHRLLHTEDFSDVIFEVNGTTFHAHKAILALESNVFYDMFKQVEYPVFLESSQDQTTTTIPHHFQQNYFTIDMKSEVFHELLNFIYTKEANLDDFTEEILVAAEKYGLVALKQQSEKALVKKINFVGLKPKRDHFSFNLV